MSKDAKEALAYGFATLMIVAAVILAGWCTVFVFKGIGNWWHSVTYDSPEEKAQQEAKSKAYDEAWAKDPRNPKVAGQACLDAGGIPDYSSWDGDVKACNKPGGGNIEVKQSVEVKQ